MNADRYRVIAGEVFEYMDACGEVGKFDDAGIVADVALVAASVDDLAETEWNAILARHIRTDH